MPEDNKWWGLSSGKDYLPGEELWLTHFYKDPSFMSRLRRWDIVDFSVPKSLAVLGDMEYTYTLPRCTLANRCYLSIRTPTSEGKTTYTCRDLPTGHSISCDIFNIERVPYPAGFGFTSRDIRDVNIEKWFT